MERLCGGLLVLVALGAGAPSYDQRQEGKINVQIDVKDLSIVALMDSGMLDDYTVRFGLWRMFGSIVL